MNTLTYDQKLELAISMLSFDYYVECIKRGATDSEAKAEMLTDKAQQEISRRVKEVLK